MDLENVKLFVALAERLNYTETARALDISQPTLSRKIKNLEEQLNVVLIHRRGNTISLTPQGEYFLKSAEKILGLMDTTIEHLHIERKGESGLIRLGCLGPMAKLVVKHILPVFQSKYPNIKLHFKTLTPDSLEVTDDLDLIIAPFLPQDEFLVSHTIGPYKRYCYASPNYINKHGRIQFPNDLELHSCIAHTNSPSIERYWTLESESGDIKQVEVKGNFTANSIDVALELAVGGFGIGLLPDNLGDVQVKKEQLVRLFEGEWFVPGKLYILHKQSTHTPQRFKAFIRHFKQHYEFNDKI